MKENMGTYQEPWMEMVKLPAAEIITLSNGGIGGGDDYDVNNSTGDRNGWGSW